MLDFFYNDYSGSFNLSRLLDCVTTYEFFSRGAFQHPQFFSTWRRFYAALQEVLKRCGFLLLFSVFPGSRFSQVLVSPGSPLSSFSFSPDSRFPYSSRLPGAWVGSEPCFFATQNRATLGQQARSRGDAPLKKPPAEVAS